MSKFVNTTQSDYLVISEDFLRDSRLGFAEIGLPVITSIMPNISAMSLFQLTKTDGLP